MKIFTLKEYAKLKGVTLQAIRKSPKHKKYIQALPLFADLDGVKIPTGKNQKFIVEE